MVHSIIRLNENYVHVIVAGADPQTGIGNANIQFSRTSKVKEIQNPKVCVRHAGNGSLDGN